ncbi:TolC family protein [Prevotella sp. PCHR]|uniref:TolC family protein n=1 Tax=Xylanibacter caecicola TaxID=2736294 RepID=A0ABX2B2B7_9BACT|nr:TolC family protein [Xylanibacter caecicola]NPE25157.1 TolC family protein [Xylanibacter caecicola]
MIKNILIAAATVISVAAQAQTPHRWTLRECMAHALENNIEIKRMDIETQKRETELSTARNSRLPDLNASAGQNFSFGRGLTAQNTYSDNNTSNTSFTLATSVPLFTGFNIPNTIELNRLNLKAALADLEKARNDIRMQVAAAYVQALYAMELLDVAQRQTAIDSMQSSRLREMYSNGKVSGVDVAQQDATLAASRLTATQANNDVRLSLLTLSQLLELPSPEGFSIARPDSAGMSRAQSAPLPLPDEIFSEAMLIKPEIQAGQLRVKGMEKSILIARSALYPKLSLTAGIGTNYYTASGFDTDGFGSQMRNNFSQNIGLNLSIPLFNRFSTRNSIRTARLNRQEQQLVLDNTKKALYKEIQQAYYNAVAAETGYRSSSEALTSSEAAFRLMSAKYEYGKANITEFNEAKNNYMKAESDLSRARYEYMYQKALLGFYKGDELDF